MVAKKHIVTVDKLRPLFTYDHKGVPSVYDFGAFNKGLTQDEIDLYLKVRANTTNIAHLRKKFNNVAGCNTCPVEIVHGKEVVLMYRHDVKRFADRLFDGTPTYFD